MSALVRRPATWVVALVAVLLTASALLGGAARPTTAAWTNAGFGTAAVTTGTWSDFGTCRVVNATSKAVVAGKPCTVTGIRWASNRDGKPVGQRTDHLYVTVSAPTASTGGNELIEVTANFAAATDIPATWVWSTSGYGGGNLAGSVAGWACSNLPTAKLYAPGWAAGGADVYLRLYENRAGVTGLACV
ncbi:hypothetical protein [Cellulomonas sp.]|uniref:hypothetical protein n=1 Tax=Cellulomonas sp. TaxID=40001 RepID=UPI002585C8BB|nr:hypothetical protein [Cellulomonas sp.]MCR6688210.1 hypothetical protein [Cellulomonas sp.]